MSTNSKKTVVIVGGGFVGSNIAKALSAQLDTTTHRLIQITASPKLVDLPATIRTVVTSEGKLEERVFMPYGDYLGGKGEVKVGEVVSFTASNGEKKGEVRLAGGEVVEYDVLVLASGNKWPGPLDFPTDESELQKHIDSWRAKIEKARSVVLVGAGAVGIEFAGEIVDFYKGKEVTIVHGARLPMNDTYTDRFRTNILNKLRKNGVNVILEDKVEDFTPSPDGTVTTKKGKIVNADLVIPTFGGTPNTQFIKQSLGEEVLDSANYVKVLPTLQIPGYSNIFAAGDIISWKEQKQAAKAAAHGGVVVKNILAVLKGQAPPSQYKGSYEIILVTFGRTQGFGYFGVLWGIIFGDWFARMLKSQDLMIDMTKKQLGF